MLIIGIPEATYWEADEDFLDNVAENKTAYDAWLNSERRKEAERAKR